VFTHLAKVVHDCAPEVRCALARVLHQHAKAGTGADLAACVVESIVPLIEELMADRSDDVRIATSLTFKELTIQFGFDFIFQYLHKALQAMVQDLQWRIRNNAVELLFGLAFVCTRDLFEPMLFDLLLAFLRDPCARVRRFALSALPNLAQRFGLPWIKASLIVRLQDMAKSPNFLHRQVYLLAISSLLNFFPIQFQSNYVFQPMIRMLQDSVQNVVVLALELLQEHRDAIHPFRKQYELKPVLDELAGDPASPVTIKAHADAFRQLC
jgi:HEAT repeat protein